MENKRVQYLINMINDMDIKDLFNNIKVYLKIF